MRRKPPIYAILNMDIRSDYDHNFESVLVEYEELKIFVSPYSIAFIGGWSNHSLFPKYTKIRGPKQKLKFGKNSKLDIIMKNYI